MKNTNFTFHQSVHRIELPALARFRSSRSRLGLHNAPLQPANDMFAAATTTRLAPRAPRAARNQRSDNVCGRTVARRVVAVASATPSTDEDADAHRHRHHHKRRSMLASTCALALGALVGTAPKGALAAPTAGPTAESLRARDIYFGNGCFWGRQHTFYEAELSLGRTDDTITSVVGYGGGASVREGDKPVCYYYGAADTVYERLGHAEVVAVDVANASELKPLADAYFASFQKIPGLGMQRVDPQDAGPGYRNCIALPGGIDSPLFKVIEEANVHGMKLVPGSGNVMAPKAKPTETDVINSVWIYDSAKLPFYPAEVYHQFHDGLGYKFPVAYTRGVKANALERGLIAPTGCPEMRERSFADFTSTTA